MARRIGDLAAYVKKELHHRLKSCPFALQIDESSDVTDLTVLLMFVRYHYEDAIEEYILLCKPLADNAIGSETFRIVSEYLEESHILWDNCIYGWCEMNARKNS